MMPIFLFIIFLLSFSFTKPAIAQTPAASAVVRVPGDIVNQDIPISQTQRVVLGITQSLGFPFAGAVRLAGNVLRIPALDAYANYLANTNPMLSPMAIQQITTDFTNPQYISGASRLCVRNPQTGKVTSRIAANVYRTKPVEFINPLTQHSLFLNSIVGRNKQENQNYNKPTIEIDPSTIVGCDTQGTGAPQAYTATAVDGGMSFEGASSVLLNIPIVADIIRMLGLNRQNSYANLTVRGVVKTQQKTPYAEVFGCNIAGCESRDFDGSSVPEETRTKLIATGGFVQSFKPASLNYTEDTHGETSNTFLETVSGGSTQQAITRFFLTSKTGSSLDFLQCSVLPKALQPAKCNRDWSAKQSASGQTSPAPAATATVGQVKQFLFEPACSGQLCYEYVLGQTLANSGCNGKYLNPYAAIAIALNETGGLASNRSDGANIKHFGCDPFGTIGIAPDPASKASCMIRTLSNSCTKGRSDAEALASYGYTPGNNLNTIVEHLEGNSSCVEGYCFRLFVSQSEARRSSIRLQTLLPAQRDYWARYYGPYLNSLTGDMLRP